MSASRLVSAPGGVGPIGVAGRTICTSATRPPSPNVGDQIYETDTAKELIYSGATVGWTLPWNQPWGIIASVISTTAFGTSATHTTYQDSGLSVAVTWPVNRKHRVTHTDTYYTPGGVQSVVGKILQGASLLTTFGLPAETMSASFGAIAVVVCETDQTAAGTGVTFKTQLAAATSNAQVAAYGDANVKRMLMIEDIGPNGLPS